MYKPNLSTALKAAVALGAAAAAAAAIVHKKKQATINDIPREPFFVGRGPGHSLFMNVAWNADWNDSDCPLLSLYMVNQEPNTTLRIDALDIYYNDKLIHNIHAIHHPEDDGLACLKTLHPGEIGNVYFDKRAFIAAVAAVVDNPHRKNVLEFVVTLDDGTIYSTRKRFCLSVAEIFALTSLTADEDSFSIEDEDGWLHCDDELEDEDCWEDEDEWDDEDEDDVYDDDCWDDEDEPDAHTLCIDVDVINETSLPLSVVMKQKETTQPALELRICLDEKPTDGEGQSGLRAACGNDEVQESQDSAGKETSPESELDKGENAPAAD